MHTALDTDSLNAALQSEQYLQVRRRIFRQLIESLIYEGIVRPQAEPAGDHLLFLLHGRDEAGQPVTYLCRGQRRFSFDRIRLGPEPVMRVAGGTAAEADSLGRFLLEIRSALGADGDRLVQLVGELEQTLLKDTLAQYRWQQEGRLLRTGTYDDLESGLTGGHPYHPSYKSRIGFDYLDNAAFGPEFAPGIQPLWLAAHREWTRHSAAAGLDVAAFLRQELGAAAHARFTSRIRARGLDPGDYLLLPVHPWQWRERLVPAFFQDLRDGRLLLLGPAEDTYRPQQSIRTLANATAPEKSSLKLALSIVNTSTSRILAPHTVENAPLISDWLKGIAGSDPFLRDELRPVLLGEVLGVAYARPQPEPLQPATNGVLACIWRESLHRFLAAEESAVPFTALSSLDLDGRPFIDPWVQAEGVERWTRRLLEVSILPVVHLLCAHGIALEAHAQNMVLIHRQGIPRRLALKDFHDGIRFAPAHLAAPERRPPLRATPAAHARVNRNSYIETDSVADVRDFMHDAFFFINLGELALFLADHYGLDERRFWSLARTVISAYQARFPHLQERFALFDLFAPTIQVEQLTKRRLYPETEVRVHRVRNPLGMAPC